MTAGNFTVGAEASPIWGTKVWSGGNGRSQDNSYTVNLVHMTRSQDQVYDPSGALLVQSYNQNWRPWAFSDHQYADPNLKLRALTALSEQVSGHNFNAVVFAAELPEALNMLVHSVRALKEVVVGFRHGDPGRVVRSFSRLLGQDNRIYAKLPRRRLSRAIELRMGKDKRWQQQLSSGDVSSAWLSIQYGWRPLLQDIYSLHQAISAWSKPGVRSFTARAYKAERFSVLSAVCAPKANGVQVRYRNSVAYKVRVVEKPSFSEGLGLHDPATVVWEKLPFSFVLDWALPIGDFLQARSFVNSLPPSTLATVSTFQSYQTGCSAGMSVVGPACGLTAGYRWRTGGNKYIRIRFVRSIETISTPSPSLASLDKAFSLGHLENAAALVHQLLR